MLCSQVHNCNCLSCLLLRWLRKSNTIIQLKHADRSRIQHQVPQALGREKWLNGRLSGGFPLSALNCCDFAAIKNNDSRSVLRQCGNTTELQVHYISPIPVVPCHVMAYLPGLVLQVALDALEVVQSLVDLLGPGIAL